MHQVRVSRFGPPDVLEVVELPDPQPGEGEVSVAVEAAGVNFSDILARMGLYRDAGKPPFVTGYEFTGRVTAVGPGVSHVQEGDDVIGMRNFGCYADRVVTGADLVLPRPAGLDAVRAAAFPVTYVTAWHALVYLGNLHPGERVLIQNAGGGVGTAAVQIARHRGATILGTASGPKLDFLRTIGVDHPIDYRTGDWAEVVRDLTDGEGVEMIFDPIAGASLRKGFELLAHTGRLIAYGVSSLAPGKTRRFLHTALELFRTPRFSPLKMMVKNRGVFGVHIGHLWHRREMLIAEMEELLALLQEGVLDPIVDTTFPLEEAARAHHYIQDRKNRGKIVLTTEALRAGPRSGTS